MLRTPVNLSVAMLIAGGLAAVGQDDVAGRGVARLSLLAGDVSVRRGDTNEWVAGAANGPLLAGDRLLSGAGSRAELQFDWATLVRLSANTEVRLSEVEQNRYLLQLARGTVTSASIRDSNLDGEISTPSIAVRPIRRGVYRVTVRETDQGPVTEVTVRSGEVEVYSPRGTQRLRPGRTLLARGEARDPEFQLVDAALEDDWDRWNERRNRELLKSSAYDYVSRDIAGADELDGYGNWTYAAPYGWVWQPRVAADWAPYRQGRWSWVDWYGWTWVSYDPWGWAPYHYGRWFWNANRWCWWPGGVQTRHFWRPALVSFVGWGGGGFSLGVGFGGGWGRVGWIPLAPYETFHPWYGSSWYGRGNNTTIINNINVTNVYRNSRVNNGLTVVEADNFGRGGAVRHVGYGDVDLGRASSVQGPLPVVPDRNSTRFSDRPTRGADSAVARGADSFYSRREARPTERLSFTDQQRGVEQIARETFRERTGPVDRGGLAGRSDQGGRAADSTGTNARGRDSEVRRVGDAGEGWHRVGSTPDTGVAASRGRDEMRAVSGSSGSNDTSGWRRFGEPRNDGHMGGVADGAARSGRGDGNARGSEPFGNSGFRDAGGRDSGSRSAVDSMPGGRSGGVDRGGIVDRGVAGDRGSYADRGVDRSTVGGAMDNGRSGWRDRSSFGDMGRRSDPVQVNPPLVRERAPDRGSFGGGSSGVDHGGFSRGDSRPQVSAPRVESAPRSESRGGPSGGSFSGGSSRSGGDGGGHSGGGGNSGGSRGGGGRRGN